MTRQQPRWREQASQVIKRLADELWRLRTDVGALADRLGIELRYPRRVGRRPWAWPWRDPADGRIDACSLAGPRRSVGLTIPANVPGRILEQCRWPSEALAAIETLERVIAWYRRRLQGLERYQRHMEQRSGYAAELIAARVAMEEVAEL